LRIPLELDKFPSTIPLLGSKRGLCNRLHTGINTYCAGCKNLLIERDKFSVLQNLLGPEGQCPFCGERVPGRF